ncbi:MAG: thermonuclease family protein [Gammaproteobacteria bacterium]|nr:thermonuclease family protein [Gammaproteobacteria bacterium]
MCLSSKQQLDEVDEWSTIAKVVDGDTLYLKDGRKIRLIGINAPEIGYRGESSQPYGRQAYDAVIQLVKHNKKIGLSFDKDKKDRYKRYLTYVTLSGGDSIEQILLSKGLAHSIVIPPNDSRIDCYRYIEAIARDKKLGVWSLSEYQWISAKSLSSKARGQRYISGVVSAYRESKKNIFLKLSSKLSIRIAKKDKKYFSGINFKNLVGKTVRVRGWINSYKGRQTVHIRMKHDLQILVP